LRLSPRLVALFLAVSGLASLLGAGIAASQSPPVLVPRAVVPGVTKAEPTPTPRPTPTAVPTPRPQPYVGPIAQVYLGSASLNSTDIEVRGTTWINGRETLQDPTAPSRIVHYPNLQGELPPAPGFPAGHTILAAHVNYIGYGNGPFAHLTRVKPGDALYLTMANGTQYAYTVQGVEIIPLAVIDMDAIVYPPLDSHRERVTLISCGGTCIPNRYGGCDYDSRVILVAERYLP
jgi:hypothetical protein